MTINQTNKQQNDTAFLYRFFNTTTKLDETLTILRQRLEETEQSVQELKKKYNLQDNPNNNNIMNQ